ncbi:MAG TPA: methyl-accepting chemotaxis protein [Ignavibacteriales bacterium]|nr:methyl-accepting chemotaxis protein [Ignavibacteriales bacterium]
MLNNRSIAAKIAVYVSLTVISIIIILSIFNITQLNDISKNKAVNDAKMYNQTVSKIVLGEFYDSYYAAKELANYLTIVKEDNYQISRDLVIKMLAKNISKNKNIFGSCTMWEPNAFDNIDEKFVNAPYHDATGRFLPYAYRGSDGSVNIEKIVNYEVDNESNEWYYKPKKIKKAILSEPYFYPVDNGTRNIFMITITIPILYQGEFVGVTTADFEIDFIQKILDNQQSIYEGSSIMMLSTNGVIVGYQGDKSKINKNISEIIDKDLLAEINNNLQNGKDYVATSGDYLICASPFTVGDISNNYGIVTKIPLSSIYAERNKLILVIIILSIIFVSIGVYAIRYLLIKQLSPLKFVEKFIDDLKNGNTKSRIQYNSEDEIGQMIQKLNEFANYLEKELIENIIQISHGKTDIIFKKKGNDDYITPVFNDFVERINKLVNEVEKLIEAAEKGKLSYRGDYKGLEGKFAEIIQGFNKALDYINKPIVESSHILEVMAKGDFTNEITTNYEGEFEILRNSINTLVVSVNRMINDIKAAIETNASASAQISSSIEEMSAGMHTQNNQIGHIANSVQEINELIIRSKNNTETATKASTNATDKAKEGGKVVNEVINGMNEISKVVDNSADKIFKLGESSEKIGEIIQVIDEIADQTNLLALNAAIEAARAGEQGRGFAVVADEVRKLAERTGKATKEIAEMIKQIQNETNEAVTSMKQGISEVEKGKVLVKKAEDILQILITSNQQLTHLINDISNMSEIQVEKSSIIYNNIDEISKISNETAIGINQISQAANDLNILSNRLSEIIQKFMTR